MKWPWVSRRAWDFVLAENEALRIECRNLLQAMLETTPMPAARQYVKNEAPKETELRETPLTDWRQIPVEQEEAN